MRKLTKKATSFILAVCIIAGGLPITISTANADNQKFTPIWPLENSRHITTFDYYSNGKEHSGIDVSATLSTPVRAIESGKVIMVGDTCPHTYVKGVDKATGISYESEYSNSACGGGLGNYIIIKHDHELEDGRYLYSTYMHLSQHSMKPKGTHVEKGDIIALSGSSGASTDPHLHFEILAGDLSEQSLRTLRYAVGKYTLQYYSQNNPSELIGAKAHEDTVNEGVVYREWILNNWTHSGKYYYYTGDNSGDYERGESTLKITFNSTSDTFKVTNRVYNFTGSVTSNYKITSIKGYIDNSAAYASIAPNTTSYTIGGKSDDIYMKCDVEHYDVGVHTLKIVAKDESGKEVTFTRQFSITDANGNIPTASSEVSTLKITFNSTSDTFKVTNRVYNFTGSVTSNYKITSIKGYIDNSAAYASIAPNTTSYTIGGRSDDIYMKCDVEHYDVGVHTLKIVAKDESGKEVTFTRQFSITDANGNIPTASSEASTLKITFNSTSDTFKVTNRVYNFTGSVTSNYKITSIKGYIDNSAAYASIAPNTTSYTIGGKSDDIYMKCDVEHYDVGVHTLKIVAKDESGKEVTFTRQFTITDANGNIPGANCPDYTNLTKIVALNVAAYFQQDDDYCSAASAKTVLTYFGKASNVTEAELQQTTAYRSSGITTALNTYLDGAYTYNDFGLNNSSAVYSAIESSLKSGYPVIGYIGFPDSEFPKTYFNYSSKGHFTTIVGIYTASNNEKWLELRDSFVNRGSSQTYCNKDTGAVLIPFSVFMQYLEYYKNSPSVELVYHIPASTYTVTYNANGGTGAPAAQTKTQGTALTLSSVKPSRSSASAGSYTVTLNANGGSVSQNTVTAAKTTNYSFKNWNTASNGSGTSYNAGASYTADAGATLYAQWNSSTSVAQVTLPTPTRTGYTFKGWGTTANATTGTTGSYTPQSDVTLYAVWQANTYTVTYNANGGTGAPSAQTKTHGAALTLSSTKPSRTSSAASSYVVTLNANGGTCSAASIEATRLTDYSFKNWNTKADGTGTAYSSGASYTTDASATLYAQWSSTTKTKSVTLPTPVRSGYTFLGWEESGNSSARFTESYTPGGNVTLNAVWQDNTFSVDINGWLDGAMAGNIAGYGTVDVWINGEKVADDVTDYSAKWPAGTSYEVKDIKATQGHAYVGVADGTLSGTVGEGYTGIRLSFSTQYTVSFDANGGDVSAANKTVLLGGKYGTLPVPSREGYRFTGWYSENALITASTVVSKDAATALTAHWEAISAEEVHLNKTTAELVVGDKVILEATITPADALNKTVTWSSSDNSVAAVDQTSGEVTAVGAGTATITATAADGSRVSASCRIVVKKSLNSYTVSFDANGGSSAPDPLTKTEGTAIVLPAAIPERSGYTFLGWSESDAATVADYAAGGSLNKDADIVLYAIWKKNDVPADAAELVIESVVARAGDTVKVTYVLKNSCELKSIALFNLTYNSDALELVSGEWMVTDTVLQNWNSTTTNGAVAFDENSKVDGEIFAATFKVKDGTGDGDYRISCDITAKTRTEMGTEEAVEIVTVDGGVTVISYISGDVDDDGNVTSDDAIYVLYYTLLPDMYPVNQPVDFDGDGQITSDDAIYLLYYTLLPDLYPLS